MRRAKRKRLARERRAKQRLADRRFVEALRVWFPWPASGPARREAAAECGG
jgi:hypothetical protein